MFYLMEKKKKNNDKAHTNCKVARSFIKETIGCSAKEQGGFLSLSAQGHHLPFLNFLLYGPPGGIGC